MSEGLQKLGFRYRNRATASPGGCRRRIRDSSHVSHLDLRHSRVDSRLSPLDRSSRWTDCRGWIPTRNGNRGPSRGRLLSRPVWSSLVCSPAQDAEATDRRRGKRAQQPGKTRTRLGRRRVKGPPRQQNQLATDVNLWQISGKSPSTGTAVSVESPRTRLPAKCFRGAASGI